MSKTLNGSCIFRRWPSICSAFLLGLAIVLFSAGIVSAQTIPITGSLHRVTEPDRSVKTYIEVIIESGFAVSDESLPDVISDIIVRDPNNKSSRITRPLSPRRVGPTIPSGAISLSAWAARRW